jgi:hypothetical protein
MYLFMLEFEGLGGLGGSSVHEGVGDGHCGDDHDIHEKGDHDDALVESDELVVLCEAVLDKIGFDGLEEVPVEHGVDNEVKAFLEAIPVLVDYLVPFTGLQTGRYPDAEYTDVDRGNEGSGCHHDVP